MFTSTAQDNAIAALCALAEVPDQDRAITRPSLHAEIPEAIGADNLKIVAKEWDMERVFDILASLIEVLQQLPWAVLGATAQMFSKKPRTCGHCGLEWKKQHRGFCKHSIVIDSVTRPAGTSREP
jgi:hypothetical protein